MLRLQLLLISTVLFAGHAVAQTEAGDAQNAPAVTEPEAPASTQESDGVKTLSGMSILGNEEAPKALVIVPWKSSQLGDRLGVTDAMDDRPRPVDKEVFMREVRYYGLRSSVPE